MSFVHVLTPVIRPQNLQAIGESITEAERNAGDRYLVLWHVMADPKKKSTGGYSLRNIMLASLEVDYDWVMMIDDDTIMHPFVLSRLGQVEDDHPDVQAMVVAQNRPNGWNPGCADPERLRNGAHTLAPDQCAFDTGQVIFRRGLIGDYRFRTGDRSGDGWFYEEVIAAEDAGLVVYVDEVLSYYNALRPT